MTVSIGKGNMQAKAIANRADDTSASGCEKLGVEIVGDKLLHEHEHQCEMACQLLRVGINGGFPPPHGL